MNLNPCIIVDDPFKPTDALTLERKAEISKWFNSTIKKRLNKTSPIIIITSGVVL